MPLSTIASNQIKNDTIVDADINSSGNITTSKLGTGAVLQVVFTASDTKHITSGNSYVEYLSLAITPKLATSKIFVRAITSFGGGANSYGSGKCDRTVGGVTTVLKNGTTHNTENRFNDASFSLQCNDDNDTYKVWVTPFDFLDSPNTTSTCTYKLHFLGDGGGRSATINRPVTNPGDGYNTPANTTLTLMEIAG